MNADSQKNTTPSCGAPAGSNGSGRRWLLAVAGLLVVATGLRVRGMFNDLWLDEIWSLDLALEAGSSRRIFTSLHNENNHYLNTLWLYFVRGLESPFGYRLPAVLAGIGSIILAGLIGLRRGRFEAVFAVLLTGLSYPLIIYSSETRGYSAAIFFAFAVFYCFPHCLAERRWLTGVLVAVSETLGLLSHLGFFSVMMSTVVWSIVQWRRSRSPFAKMAVDMVICHALPWVVFAVLYFLDIRWLKPGEGYFTSSYIDSYGSALSWAVGTSLEKSVKLFACIGAVVAIDMGIRLIVRSDVGMGCFFFGTIVLFPAMLLAIRQSDVVYVRYFLPSIAFLAILLSYVLGDLCRRGRGGRWISGVFLTYFVFINGLNTAKFWEHGRGHYQAALRYIDDAAKPTAQIVTISGDEEFRNLKVLQFHAPLVNTKRSINYAKLGHWPAGGCDFVIVTKESFEPPVPPVASLKDSDGNLYHLVKDFPSAPLTGMHWFIYRNAAY